MKGFFIAGMYKVYVLYSKKSNKIYIGFTTNLRKRLLSHNELGGKDWTRSYRPWILILIEEDSEKAEALKREQQLKGGQGREYIRKQELPLYI